MAATASASAGLGGGYSSDPTASRSRLEGTSFSSLLNNDNAAARLQSTPNAKFVHQHHRVQRVPASSSQTGTGTATEDSELSSITFDVSLTSSRASKAAAGGAAGPEETAKRPLPVRQYWNNLLLESAGAAEKSSPSHLHAPRKSTANAPSTGSSTLVDQESLPGDAQPGPSNLQYQYSQLEQEYERPASAPPAPVDSGNRRASPLQHHLSRFASSYTADNNHLDSSRGSRESSTTPQPSLGAARVHDIFARHVHNAPASTSTSRNTSLAISGDGRPRQRLRDLLTPSERRSAVVAHHHHHEQAYSPEMQSRPSPKRKLRRPISPITNAQAVLNNSPDRSAAGRQNSWPGQYTSPQRSQYDRSGQTTLGSPSRGGARLVTVGRSLSDQSLNARAKHEVASRLSREWQSVVAQSAISDTESGLEGEEEEADADVEDEEADISPDLADGIAEEDEQLTDIQEPDFVRGASEEQEQEAAGEESDDFSPRYTTEEELEGEDDPEPGEETREIGSAKVFLAERRASPRVASPAAIKRVSPSGARIAPDANLSRTSPQYLGNSRTRRTPPKTPHPPGFYQSTTPSETMLAGTSERRRDATEATTPLPPRHSQGDPSRLDSNRSRLFGFLNTPAPPGAYASPFPHPKRAPQLLAEIEEQEEPEPSFSQAKMGSVLKARSTTPQSSPAKTRRSPAGKASPLVGSPSRPMPKSPEWKTAVMDTSPSKRARSESTESVLHSMLAEVVKPLKSLLSSISTPRQAAHAYDEDASIAVVKRETTHEDALRDRRIRKSDQDAILYRLAEADRLDQSLSTRLEDVRRAVDEMGQNLSMQVSDVLSTSFAHESRRRKGWLFLAILLELFVLWAIFSFADRRAELLHQTTYFDPFYPSLYSRGSVISFNPRIPPSFISSFLETPPLQARLEPINWPTAMLQRLLAYKSIASGTLSSYLGTSDFVHGTYTQLGHLVSNTVSGSAEQAYRIPT